MSNCTFHKLLSLVGSALSKTYCVREPISSEERLAVTLRYLASGDSMISISYAIMNFIYYRFALVDIGAEGRHSDGGIFKNSNMGKLINANNLHFPPPLLLGQGDTPFNFYIVGDEAFPLTTSIMRPYSGRFLPRDKCIFNYRLSRGRRVIENAFGILASRWRIYRRTIIASESTVVAVVKATVCLHNFLINNGQKFESEDKYITASTVDHENETGELVHDDWRSEHDNNLTPIGRMGSNMYAKNAETMRQNLLRYFINEGAIDFQENK
ncbi:uncharacterized protein [Diabrotica undecimpunctata]|uniref:uncharacterized protein n=1 Tax=Diabrotica undecimpunctata TaxID=50387 RepID=UPI003B63DDF8